MPASELYAEDVLGHLEKGRLSPVYLFYGESDFLLEKVLNKIRETFIPVTARDFNLQVFYGDEIKTDINELIATARSFPFMAQNRLLIVRRTEEIPASSLETLIPYLEQPMESNCLIFISQRPDFRKKFYKKIKALGSAVNFKKLYDNKVVPWIMKSAKEIGLNLDSQAAVYLHQIVGNRLRDLYSELEKIYIHYGNEPVRLEEVKHLAVYSRSYTIFELMDQVSSKRPTESISVLRRFTAEEGKDSVLGIMGMFIRQIRLLWQAKSFLEGGGRSTDLAKALGVHPYTAKILEPRTKGWRAHDFQRAFDALYQADGLIKTGSDGGLVLENVILSLCR